MNVVGGGGGGGGVSSVGVYIESQVSMKEHTRIQKALNFHRT